MRNILFVGAGRRNSMARKFKELGFKIYSYEDSLDVPIAYEATVYKGKKFSDPDFREDVNRLCKEIGDFQGEPPSLIIPFDCGAAHHLNPLDEAAGICYDKAHFANWMNDNFPDWYPFPEYGKCFVVKPINGNGSKGIVYSYDYEQEDMHYDYQEWISRSNCISQSLLEGPEYSVDAYFGLDGRYVNGCVRERTKVVGGEVIESITVKQPDLIDITRRIGQKMGIKGPCCAQYMWTKDDRPKVIEVNKRLGGGATLSIQAGLNFPLWLKTEYMDKLPIPDEAYFIKPTIGLRLSRSYRDHFFLPAAD